MAFLEVALGGSRLGWLTFQLFDDVCPRACENFRRFCQRDAEPSFQNTCIQRIVPGLCVQFGLESDSEYLSLIGEPGETGEVGGSGEGRESGFLRGLEGDRLGVHDSEGALCTASPRASLLDADPFSPCHQFYIALAPCRWQDGRDIVFGRLIGGQRLLRKIESFGSSTGAVTCGRNLAITTCGVFETEAAGEQTGEAGTLEGEAKGE